MPDAKRIRELNDNFRRTLIGGRVMMTCGVSSREDADVILRRVQQFDDFGPDNDPHGEHDFGQFEVGKQKIFWKLDYLRGTVRGIHVFETTGTDDREAAEAIRIKRESAVLDRSIFGPAATMTFAEAALSYLEEGGERRFLGTYDNETGEWSLLIGHFGNTVIGKIRQAEVDTAAIVLYPEAQAATRKRQVYVPVSAVLRHAARKGGAPSRALGTPG